MTYLDGVNAEALDKFLDALESGNYRQGIGRLHTAADGSMCCLGVATNVLGPACGVVLQDVIKNDISRHYRWEESFAQYHLLMPPPVTALLGIPPNFIERTDNGDILLVPCEEGDDEDNIDFYPRGDYNMVGVSSLNDNGYSFTEIARRIRQALTKKEN